MYFVFQYDETIIFSDPTPKIKGEETTYNTLFIGQTVFVFCEYEACDSPATITWYRVSKKTTSSLLRAKGSISSSHYETENHDCNFNLTLLRTPRG